MSSSPETAPAPKKSRAGRDLPAAIASGVGLVALILVTLFFQKALFALVVLAAVVVAIWELDRGFRVAANYRFSDEDFLIRQENAACSIGLHGTPFCNALGRSRNSVLSIALSLDRRDSATSPTRGFQLRLTQDVADQNPSGQTALE